MKQQPEEPLFYEEQELVAPCGCSFFLQGDVDEFDAPLVTVALCYIHRQAVLADRRIDSCPTCGCKASSSVDRTVFPCGYSYRNGEMISPCSNA